MNNWKLETEREFYQNLNILLETDILVVGGGSAGVAASVTAGESGFKTTLIEKYGFCGGSAVAGMSATVCGIYETFENNSGINPPKQIVFGFTERFLKTLEKNNGLTPIQIYGNTYVKAHEARVWKESADELLEKANVKILYHTSVIGVLKDKEIVIGVIVNSGLGLGIIKAKRIIDCSGDGIVAAMAGNEFHCGINNIVQNPTIIFKISNIDNKKFWNYYGRDTICHDEFTEKLYSAEKIFNSKFPRKKIWVFKTINDSEIFINATAVHHETEKLNMINPEHFTYSEKEARKQMELYFKFFKEFIPGCENSFIGEVACEVGVRQTRSIKGKYTLTNEDVENCRKFEDGIVKSSWPIELHKGERPKLYWLINNYYEIPFRCLQPSSIDNLLVAGRCLSAEHEALASARVTAQCFEYGRAAAIGAILSLKGNYNTSMIDGKKVKEIMNEE